MEKKSLTNLIAAFDKAGPADQHAATRKAARARLEKLSPPTSRSEDWRFTNIAPILETSFELPLADQTIDVRRIPAPTTPNVIRLVFANGRLLDVVSTHADLPAGVQIESLAESAKGHASLAKIADEDESFFTALNTSFLDDGALIVVPDGKVVEQPIEIIYLSEPTAKPLITQTRNLIVIGKNAQASIVERYLGGGAYLTNAVTEISLAENAVVDHVKLQQESMSAFHIANTQITMAAHSNFTSHYLGLGGSLVRNEVRVRFDGEHAEATVNGLYLASGKQHLDNFTVIDHAKPNCASHELYKGILNDKSHGVFNGKIFVRKDAQKTDAKQTNKVLLLSDDATINTKPQLEIFADDVKCTHGATIGQLDATQMFYLRSRGIPVDAARRLLTFAFANDIVGRLKIEALRDELEKRIVS
jgi:Fe-S cluster assembly protein SufD